MTNKKSPQFAWDASHSGPAVDQLQRSIVDGSIPHALLLVGASEQHTIGIAHEFANSMLCSAEQRPCNNCAACRSYAHVSSPDVMIIRKQEGYQMMSIEDIRSAIHFLQLVAPVGSYRLVIIENAESMNILAAAALLKTLEDAPRGACVILTTSSLQRIPGTIRSRCAIVRLPDQEAQPLQDIGRSLVNNCIALLREENLQSLSRFAGLYDSMSQSATAVKQSEIAADTLPLVDTFERVVRDSLLLPATPRVAGTDQYTAAIATVRNRFSAEALFRILRSLSVLRRTLRFNVHPRLAWEYFLLQLSNT